MSDMTPAFRRFWIGGLALLVLALVVLITTAVLTKGWLLLAMGGSMVAAFSSLLTILAAQHIAKNQAAAAQLEGDAHAAG